MASSDRIAVRVKTWANELVDLSRRNTSLFYKPIKRGTLQILAPAPVAALERLQRNQEWGFFSPPPATPGAPPWTIQDSVAHAGAGELVTERTTRSEVEAALKNLARLANLDLVDRGLESLYLCFGMLHWRREDETEDNRSPLLFIPVNLVRSSPRDPFRLARLENDPVLNLSLRVLLEQEFDLTLPEFDLAQTQDVDLGALWDGVAEAVRHRGWRVEPNVVLKRATFHKEAMFKDLTDNLRVVCGHPLVRFLADPDDVVPADVSPPAEEELDAVAPPERARLILDADGSQRRAIAAARGGVNFVMDGPPGTGKSQTIANIIAELIADGKSVLFVSEKLAALQVVAARLGDRGLSPFLLELHGQKVGRREVAGRLGEALRRKPVGRPRLTEADLARAEKLRARLSSYADALNRRRDPLGQSIEEVVGRLAQLADVPAAPTPTAIGAGLSAGEVAELIGRFQRLSRVWAPVADRPDFVWLGLRAEHTSPRTRPDLEQVVDQLNRTLQQVADLSDQLADETALRVAQDLLQAEWLVAVLQEVLRQPPTDKSWWTSGNLAESLARLAVLDAEAQDQRRDVDALEAAYGQDWNALDSRLAKRWDELSEALGGLLLEPVGPTVPELARQVVAARETVEFATQLQAEARDLAAALRAPDRDRTITECLDLALVASHADAHVRPETQWSSPSIISRVEAALTVLGPLVDHYQKRRSALEEVFTPEIEELDLASLVVRFEQRHKGLRKLSTSYREDKRAVASVARIGKATKDVRSHLREALELQEAGRTLDAAYARSKEVLGSFAQERETDVGAAGRALSVLREAAERLRQDYDASGVAAQLCGEAPQDPSLADRAQRTVQRIEDWRSGPGRVLFGEQVDPAMPLTALIHQAEEAAKTAAALLELATEVETRRLQPADLSVLGNELRRRADVDDRARRLREEESRDRRRFGYFYAGHDTDIELVGRGLRWAGELQEVHGGPLTRAAADQLHDRHPPADPEPLAHACAQARKLQTNLLDRFDPSRAEELREELEGDLGDACGTLGNLADRIHQIDVWRAHTELMAELRTEGWKPSLDYVTGDRTRAEQLPDVLERALWTAWYNAVSSSEPALASVRADDLTADLEEFRRLDHELLTDAAQRVAAACAGRRPVTSVGQAKIIEREAQKRSRHMPVRLLLEKTAEVTRALKPCFLMSPLSVSEFLPPSFAFDVVIFDEASQVTPADAINCVYRGGQLIVAGDDKQLPPTNFFDRTAIDESDSYDEEQPDDFESVLGLCKGTAALHSVPLQWHYRSQHETLINFSNGAFYDGQLVTFPGADPAGPHLGVSLQIVDGVYEGGTSRTNRREAQAVARRVIDCASVTPDRSLGVVTFSQAQAEAVENEVERLRLDRPDLDRFFALDIKDAFFVKALENVQGDERDVILFSVGYGPQADGSFSANFGPLNRKGGERRLNVAVTRARRKVEVFSSFQPEALAGKAKAVGLVRLLEYMRYAREVGAAETRTHGVLAPDEALAGVVAEVLRKWGHEVDLGVGMSSYRLDLAVRDPKQPGAYLLGIELDGASYASSPVARDRDRLRQEVLGRLGWRLHRVWGPAWYLERAGSEQRLRQALQSATRGEARATRPAGVRAERVELHEVEVDLDAPPAWAVPYEPTWPMVDNSVHPAGLEAMSGVMDAVSQMVAGESPVSIELVIKRIAWQYGVNATKRVRQAVERAVATLERRGELTRSGDTLLGDRPAVVRVPSAADGDSFRDINHITPEELALAVRALVRDARAMSEEELVNSIARLFGFKRTGAKIRQAIEEVSATLCRQGDLLRAVDGTLQLSGTARVGAVHADAADDLRALIDRGESAHLEFKSSLRANMTDGSVMKELEKVVAKTVAGFLNAEGGTLLIGVADDGSLVGLEPDYRTLGKKGTRDGFELHLTQVLSSALGLPPLAFIRVAITSLEGRDVCQIDVKRSPEPVYVADKQGATFYARMGNATQPLPVDAAHRYIHNHWK
ncbi:MAG TPA: DUF4011 domain-containing protein [Egibacteraceae bacterium]|jgi:very-short-patch-repair endonuclease|nr:DUF4011 domain-containing protein [Egibacteraceae bacterium]